MRPEGTNMRCVVQLLTAGDRKDGRGNGRRDVSVASRHVSLIRPGATEAQSDDTYEVDDCFGSELGTTEAYKRTVHPIVRQTVDGYNGALITVGCSGSGKSTLLHGRTGNEGVVRLAIKGVFEALHNKAAQVGVALSQHKASGGGGAAMEFAVDASFCEIYEERCRDLFAAAAAGGKGDGGLGHHLEVEESADEGWHVAGLTYRHAPDASSLQAAYAAALNARATGLSEYGHSKHDRAASILTIRISQYVPAVGVGDGMPAQHLVSTLVVVDTPGAEPLAMDPAVLRLREGARLNRAVNALAGVIRALATQRRDFASHGDSILTKVLAEPLGGNCATTVLATLRLGEWERSAAVMDLIAHARRAPTFPVVCNDSARGLQRRLRSRLLQINEERETYREQIQSQPADGIDPDNVGLQMAKLHELEGRLVEERGDKAELLAEKEALLERLHRLNGMDKQFLAEKEELQSALIRSEEDRLEIARALVEAQLEANEAALDAEKTKHELMERLHEYEQRAVASEVRVKGAEQARGEIQERAGMLNLDNERLKEALDQTRLELEEQLAALRSEHADVMGEVGGLKARNEDLVHDIADLQKRLSTEVRRAEEAEEERDDLKATAEKDASTNQKRVEAAERAAEEAIAAAEETKKRAVEAAEKERDEAVASAKASKEKAVAAANEERDEEIAKAKAAKERAVQEATEEKEKAVAAAQKEKEEAIAAAEAEKEATTSAVSQDRDTKVQDAQREKDEAVNKAHREKEEAIAAAQAEKDAAVAAAEEAKNAAVAAAEAARDEALAALEERTASLKAHANEAHDEIEPMRRELEAAKSAEAIARGEADRALGEAAQLKEKLESSRAQFSARLKEHLLQVADLERGAQVLGADPDSEHVLRPSQLQEAAQKITEDLHATAADQAAENRRVTEDLQTRLTKAQKDVRSLHTGYRALRHRFEDLAPVEGGGDIGKLHVPHEDSLCLGGAPPTPAEARDIDARGLAQKLADLRDENARLQQQVRMAALDGRGPLAPKAKEAAHNTDAQQDILFYDEQMPRKAQQDGDSFHQSPRRARSPEGDGYGGKGESARLRAENAKLQAALDELRQKRPSTNEEEVRRENGKLKAELEELSKQDKSRAQLAKEVAELKRQLAEKNVAGANDQRSNFTEQRAAIKEFTERVQAELEKENRTLATRAAIAEEQVKETNAYMAQSTLAYQKEIMRLRSIIQATAPERLNTPPGGGSVGGGYGAVRASRSGGGDPRNAAPAVDAWGNGGERLGAGGVR